MNNKLRVTMIVLAALVAAAPVYAGSAVIGSVAGSLNATVGGQALVPNSVIFSGDSLQVRDGAAVIALENGSRMAFGRETEASFLRGSNGVEVLLGRGDVSMYQSDGRLGVAVKAGEYEVKPATGYKTLGEVAMLNGLVTVTAKEGPLKVEGGGQTVEVAQGKTITLGTKTARAPLPQTGGSQNLGGNNTLLIAGALGAGVVAAILAGIAMSRAGDANSSASAAVSAANAATSAANAAESAASAAGSTAAQAANNANNAGCALNVTANDQGMPSPYSPISPYTCPAVGVALPIALRP
jgi:trimeric autotransporter adhesin